MNIYFVNRYSNYRGPFDISASNRKHIINVGDICLRDYKDGVDFLLVCSSENSWSACKRVGTGNNGEMSGCRDTLLFSFDGISRRKGNISLIKNLSTCFREKVVFDFFCNAIDILEYRRDSWDSSLFSRMLAPSQELITDTENGYIPLTEVANVSEAETTGEHASIGVSATDWDSISHADEIQAYIINDFNNKEFRKLLYQYRKGDKRAIEKIVKSNKKLVAIIANSFRGCGVEYEDLMQEGSIGLIKAIERFNPKKNVPFPKYAKWSIHQAIVNALNKTQSLVKIPQSKIVLYQKVKKCVERYEQEHGYEPSATEIDIDEYMELDDITYIIGMPDGLQNLSISRNDWDEYPGNDSADKLLMKEAQVNYINRILSKLKKREAYVLRHLYGIGEKIESLSEIGESLMLTRERVRQISEEAVRRLRELLFLQKNKGEEQSPKQEENNTDTDCSTKQLKRGKNETKQATQVLYTSSNHRCDGGEDACEKRENTRSFSRETDHITILKREHKPQSLSLSTPLEDLVNLGLITKRQHKQCKKRNLRTICDIVNIIKKYHLTPESTRFTKYTIELWFSIASLSDSNDLIINEKPLSEEAEATENKDIEEKQEIKERQKYVEQQKVEARQKVKVLRDDRIMTDDGIEHVYVGIPTAEPYTEKECPPNEASNVESSDKKNRIEIKKLKTVFEKKASSYKYFWFMAIISLAKEHGVLSISFKDITIRMATLAWPLVFEDEIELGSSDMMKKYLGEVVKRTQLIRTASANVVKSYLERHYLSQGIGKILAPLMKNVPYRFLSPWIKYTSDEDVIEKSCSNNFDGLYALHHNYIVLNNEWWEYIESHYQEVCDFALQSFLAYARKYNNDLKLVKLMKVGWKAISN